MLFSYQTPIAFIIDGKAEEIKDNQFIFLIDPQGDYPYDYSSTTACHVIEFMMQFSPLCRDYISKSIMLQNYLADSDLTNKLASLDLLDF